MTLEDNSYIRIQLECVKVHYGIEKLTDKELLDWTNGGLAKIFSGVYEDFNEQRREMQTTRLYEEVIRRMRT